ncbi:MAG: adenylate/guanylate cyclase domain-containing protein [Acidimicrobiia bacterium]
MTPCPACGSDNPAGFRFCGSCGSPLVAACPNCGAETPPGFRFCGACGRSLIAKEEMAGERRPVTVLFADLVGFSSLAEHLDPEELRGIVTQTFADLAAEVEARDGQVDTFIGDSVVAVFGAPRAHEDDPVRAVESALAMLEAVRRRSPSPTLQLRIGINSGLVVAGAVGDGSQTGVLGDPVNVAARLQQAAEPGQVLLSEAVYRRVRERFECEPVGHLEVKGRVEAVSAYRVVGLRGVPQRRQAPFVGRRDERALLELLWSSARRGNTHVVSVVGEPGVGKSRLLTELPLRAEALDLRVACGSDRAFGPFLDLLEQILGRLPGGLRELTELTSALGIEEGTARPLAALLGLAGAPPVVRMADEQQKRQVFAGVWHFLSSAMSDRPGLVLLDDVHWADQSSLDLLGFLLEQLAAVPLMLVLAYRPGFDPIARAELRASHTLLRLEPLTPEESLDLAQGFLGVTELPGDLERLLTTRAEGNPFFIEELLQALLELGSLAVEEGRAMLAETDLEVPDTVQGTILARVDRQGARERIILQHAAVIGRTFSTDLVEAVIGADEVRPALDRLARAQLLVTRELDQWAFKHALIQEVVYDTLLLSQRREMHRKVAESLEPQSKEDPGLMELLAEHYARAEVADKARQYALAAGDLASERMGFVEARHRYQTALRLWGEGDERGRLSVMMRFANAAYMAGDAPAARTSLIEAEAGWRELGELHQAGAALTSLGRVYWITGEVDRAAEALERAIELLQPEGPSPDLVQAHVWASTLNMLIGRADLGAELAGRGLEMAEGLGLEGARSHLLNTLGCCEVNVGDPSGLELIRLALELAERSGEAEALGRAYVNLPSTLSLYSLHEEAAALCRRGREVMRKLGSPSFEWFIAGNEAGDLVELGRYEEAESLCRQMLGEQRPVLGVPGTVNALGTLASSLIRRGSYEEARRITDELLPLARRMGGSEYLAPNLIEEALLEEARGNPAAARQAAAEAVSVVLDTPSLQHGFRILVPVVYLLPPEETAPFRQRLAALRDHPSQVAILTEAGSIVQGDRSLFAQAADLYGALDLPYQEARARLGAGDLERARRIIERFGLEEGPLGARLRAAALTTAPGESPL